MSIQVTTAFVNQFSANVMQLAQQKGSKLRGAVRQENITGKSAFFDQIGPTAARRRTTRHSDTPRMDTPHARRRLSVEDFDWADLIDQEDKVRMLIDPTSSYAQAAANAMGRSIDEVIVDAIRGTAQTDETGSTAVVLPTTSKIAVAATGLTKAKMITAKGLMDRADIDSDGRYIATTSEQVENLLNITEVTSSDYATVKALVQGEVNTWLGFTFINVNGLRADGTKIIPKVVNDRFCVAWQRDNVVLGIGANPNARISERADKNYATQVFYAMTIGAVRMQEAGVVELSCLEA